MDEPYVPPTPGAARLAEGIVLARTNRVLRQIAHHRAAIAHHQAVTAALRGEGPSPPRWTAQAAARFLRRMLSPGRGI